MACACGGGARARRAAGAATGKRFVYDYTAPGSDVTLTYSTYIEVKREIRRNGGGKTFRRQVNSEAAA